MPPFLWNSVNNKLKSPRSHHVSSFLSGFVHTIVHHVFFTSFSQLFHEMNTYSTSRMSLKNLFFRECSLASDLLSHLPSHHLGKGWLMNHPILDFWSILGTPGHWMIENPTYLWFSPSHQQWSHGFGPCSFLLASPGSNTVLRVCVGSWPINTPRIALLQIRTTDRV